MKIVLVEDESRFYVPMEKILRALGHEVVTICEFPCDLDACIVKILEANPDRVLLDHTLKLSVFDGDQIAAKLSGIRTISTSSIERDYTDDWYPDKDYLQADPALDSEWVQLLVEKLK